MKGNAERPLCHTGGGGGGGGLHGWVFPLVGGGYRSGLPPWVGVPPHFLSLFTEALSSCVQLLVLWWFSLSLRRHRAGISLGLLLVTLMGLKGCT